MKNSTGISAGKSLLLLLAAAALAACPGARAYADEQPVPPGCRKSS